MKASLEFTLPDERHEHTLAVRAPDIWAAYRELADELRSLEKYGHKFADADDAVRCIREMLYQVLKDHGLQGLFEELP